jgi:hypothetical protein
MIMSNLTYLLLLENVSIDWSFVSLLVYCHLTY